MKFSEYQSLIASGSAVTGGDVSVPKEARPFQGRRAGFITRLAAVCVDIGSVVLTIALVNGLLALIRFIVRRAAGAELPQLGWSVIAGTLLLWALWTWGWATTGRSLGDHIMGLRVVSHSGHALGWATAAVRAAFCLAFPFGLLWVLVSGANRSVQDVVLRTSVIHEWVIAMPSVPEGELSPEAQPSAELPTEEP